MQQPVTIFDEKYYLISEIKSSKLRLAKCQFKMRVNMVAIEECVACIMQLDGIQEQPHFDKRSFRYKQKVLATLNEASMQVVLLLSAVDQSVYCAIEPSMIYPVQNKWGMQGWTVIELQLIDQSLLEEMLSVAYQTLLAKSRKKK